MPISGAPLQKWFAWGSEWKARSDEQSIDLDGSMCNHEPVANASVRADNSCANEEDYRESFYWCGYLKSKTKGPWAQCLSYLDRDAISNIYDACVFDLCQTEAERSKQEIVRCSAFQGLHAKCLNISQFQNFSLPVGWRAETNCGSYDRPFKHEKKKHLFLSLITCTIYTMKKNKLQKYRYLTIISNKRVLKHGTVIYKSY